MDAARRIVANNRSLAFFLLKMAAAYAVWFVVYDLFLLPDGRLDGWLSHSVASATASVLQPFYDTAFADGRTVWIQEGTGVLIEDGCNGLSAFSLFVGFVIAYPGSWARRAWFIPLGLVALVVTNILRCAILLMTALHIPEAFDSVHGFHALFVFYVVIFLMWMAWAHWGGSESGSSRPSGPSGGAAEPALATA